MLKLAGLAKAVLLLTILAITLPLSFRFAPAEADPTIVIDQLPPFGTWGVPLVGHIDGIDPSSVKLAFFIKVDGGIWTKPYFNQPTIDPRPDGTFSAVLTTGGIDDQADTIYVALLDRSQANLPQMAGQGQFPDGLQAQGIVWLEISRPPVYRELQFSGRQWSVKHSARPVDPGPTPFSDDQDHVSVDDQGRLHVRIAPQQDGRWAAAEVVSDDSFGYGTFDFGLATPVGDWDSAVLGLFTWDTGAPQTHNREIDLEFGRGLINSPPDDAATSYSAQDVLQPYGLPMHRHRFILPSVQPSRHGFLWAPKALVFASRGSDDVIDTWTYTGDDVPTPGNQTHVRLNLWMFGGRAPAQPVEVIVSDFTFTPLDVSD